MLNYHPYDVETNSKLLFSLTYNFASYFAVEASVNVACKGALQSSGVGGSALFGQAFMMAQFLILNVGDRTIGFAEIAPDL